MISQQQNDIHVPEEGTPPPLDQKQPSAPTFSWRSWNLWLRIIGVVLAFAGVFVFGALGADLWELVLFILVFVVSAGLIRSWWSFLIVPGAFSLGILIMAFIYADRIPFDEISLSSAFQADPAYVIFIIIPTLLIILVPVEIGVAIGTPIGKLIEKRLRH